MKPKGLLIAVVLALPLFAACGDLPTGAAVAPAGPSFDGGFTMGSGNRSIPEPDPQTQTQSAATGEVAADSTAFGGFTMGSGN